MDSVMSTPRHNIQRSYSSSLVHSSCFFIHLLFKVYFLTDGHLDLFSGTCSDGGHISNWTISCIDSSLASRAVGGIVCVSGE